MSNVISVTQFNTYVHNIFLAEEILQNISIYGEVSAVSFSGPHMYFSIKDEGGVLNCVKFGARDGYIPKEGEQILCVGAPNYYIKGGRFSFNVVRLEPYGQGLLYKKFLELKQKLEKLGYFDAEKKKPLPIDIKRVGVISSETGAVIQDIIDITGRRNPMLDIVLYPAKVQGIGAESTIIAGLLALDKTDVDVIIIARGGGSAEDLSTFNDEMLAHAIFNTNKPVISAVGHETDFTICDLVADLRAPTPSAAAELVAIDLVATVNRLNDYTRRLLYLSSAFFDRKQNDINLLFSQIYKNSEEELLKRERYLSTSIASLKFLAEKKFNATEHKFNLLASKLENINPIKILRMGYGQISRENHLVRSINQVELKEQININLADGQLTCLVTGKKGDTK